MKSFASRIAVLVIAIALVSTGLGQSFAAETTTTSSTDQAQTTLRIGLITDVGQIDDKSFNQSAWEGVQRAQEAYDAEIDFIETQDSADYANNIAEFAEQDYDIIVTVGFALAEATVAAASDYPDVQFIGVDQFQGEVTDNVTGIIFNEDKAGFLAGVLAGGLTESGVIAGVLGTDQVPPVVAFGDGYESGARWAADRLNKEVEVITTYHPGGLDVAFTDPQWGAATAAQALDQGADVVFGAGGRTGNGALIEVATAGGYCIGVDTDQWQTVPEAHECLVSSALKRIDDAVYSLITATIDETIEPGNFVGEVGLAPFYDFDSDVSDEIRALLSEAESGLQTGAVLTCYNQDLSDLRVGLVSDIGQIDDGGFNESSWNGVLAAAHCGAEVIFLESESGGDYESNIDLLVSANYGVIVTVGFAITDATIAAAAEYPDVRFIGVDQFQGEVTEGVTGLIFAEDQAGYLAGVLAANLTESDTVAAVLGTDQIPPVVAFGEGYRLGAQSVNEDIEVILNYHPGDPDIAFVDPEWGAVVASLAIDDGADVVFAAAGSTGNGALTEVATVEDAYCIGVDTDQWLTVPDAHNCLVSSAVKQLDAGVATLIVAHANGTIEDGNYVGQVGLADYHDFADEIPQELQDELAELTQALADGTVTTGY